ncbi:2-amino-4-hydroxy-6-hydroxymethyldihydropteridine diphosphokinase [Rickettsiales endosymbiont of Stachyamoeba lipophora]|uniref:2-amino-4-hydroxy-6- hydroxymethyldihydropteridine diphosphokinase n=1 Tax=Rickettsiales endosymbiont of Stachyamoeba lipophora TaxID=2486578 RepID=UPI000F6476F8|nr:2-amino-4-hydroxy-6-hydroxymethyldihydropteridine diphosphokinase [Rickettsiales endosymbiont of Stachyamoeba lipophora]AZL16206.1 2-amino-4-hydroxy-6-hydroxymethyldihydropteridine diphosphokinase [Rickettsiales endosymbiont of Stachyamoeba lipophora]
MANIALGLGSNLGDLEYNIAQAISLLRQKVSIQKVSSYLYNKALLPPNAPKEWEQDFLNIALIGQTTLPPHELLNFIKNIEEQLGRTKNYQQWSPRIIDIDILLYDHLQINEGKLQIPHKEMLKRDFVIIPLKEILPNLKFKDL